MGSRKKSSTLLVSVFGLIALLSVGFASWEITNASTSASASGNISADTVVDKRLKIEGGSWNSTKIYFGCDIGNTSYANPWLSNTSSETASMSATYSFNIICPSDKVMKLSCKGSDFKVSGDTSSAWSTAKSKNYVNEPTFSETVNTNNATDYAASDGATDMKSVPTSVTITFAWGSAFNSVNPYQHYNSASYSDSSASEALEALQAIYALNGLTFSFTITVSLTA